MIVTKKIRFYPNQAQKRMIKDNLATASLLHNETCKKLMPLIKERMDYFKKQGTKCVVDTCKETQMHHRLVCHDHITVDIWNFHLRPEDIRDDMPYKDSNAPAEWDIIKKSTIDIRDAAICRAVVDFTKCLDRKIIFDMKDLAEADSYNFRGRSIKGNFSFTNKTLTKEQQKIRIRHQEKIKGFVESEIYGIIKDCAKYYLIYHDKIVKHATRYKQGLIALDPGSRTFNTCYDDQGQVFKFGEKIEDKIKVKFKRIDELKKMASIEIRRSKVKCNLKKKIKNVHRKIRGLVNDLHNHTASFLTKNYNMIFLPKFGSKEMKQGLRPSTNRMMDALSHYQFRSKVSAMAMRRNTRLCIVDEYLTTKTCGHCGVVNNNLKEEDEWICGECGVYHDRDVNAARNILMRSLILCDPLQE